MRALSRFIKSHDNSWEINRFTVLKICFALLYFIMTVSAPAESWPFIIFFSIIAVGTYCSDRMKSRNIFAAFSVKENWKNLIIMDRNESSSTFSCFHGIKAISIMWIVLGHRFSRMESAVKPRIPENIRPMLVSFINSYPCGVDIFFAIGAILMTQSCLKAFDS